MLKSTLYTDLITQLRGLLETERDPIANAANVSALIFGMLPDLNWVGFYFLREDELVVGPFQGRPACTRISLDRGVCGAAVTRRETLVVANVHDFPGHIACDAASNAEIVVPLIVDGRLIGVLDLDSPTIGRFDEEDRVGLEQAAAIFLESTQFDGP